PAEITRMKEEAEMYAGEDEQRKIIAELQNRADSLFYSYESTLRDSAGTVTEELKLQAEAEAEALRAAIADKSVDPSNLAQKLDALQQTIFNIGAGIYRQAGEDDYGSDMNNEMPGANMSEAAAPAVNRTPEPAPAVPTPAPAGAPAATPATPTPAPAAAPASRVYAPAEEEFDIDSTVAADYEAIE
ncbi:MAG: Hsp70 family protein, partial [Cyanobacteria bacterium J06635_11]